jgi:DHA1 family tetracycline resistance protein-like MFS transporter
VIWSTVALDQIVFSMVLPVLPFVARRYGASPLVVTALVSIFALAQFLVSPFVGALSDRVGRKPILVVSLFGSAVGSLVLGLAGSLPLLFLGRAVDGLSGTALVSAQTAITDMVPAKQRARFLGLLGSAFAVGFIVGPGLSALASRWDERLPFFIAAGLGAINAAVAIVRLPETRPEEDRRVLAETRALGSEDRSPLAAFRRAGALPAATWFYIGVLAAGLLAFSAVEGGTFTLLADDRFGFTAASIAAVFAWVGIVLALVQVLAVGPLNARAGVRGAVVAALVVNAIGFTLVALAGRVWMLVVAVSLNALGQGVLRPTCTSAVSSSAPPQLRGLAIGTQTSAQGLVRIVGPLVAGLLYTAIGPGAPFAAGAAIVVVAAAVVLSSGGRYDAEVA